jgi:hypothetical protein
MPQLGSTRSSPNSIPFQKTSLPCNTAQNDSRQIGTSATGWSALMEDRVSPHHRIGSLLFFRKIERIHGLSVNNC